MRVRRFALKIIHENKTPRQQHNIKLSDFRQNLKKNGTKRSQLFPIIDREGISIYIYRYISICVNIEINKRDFEKIIFSDPFRSWQGVVFFFFNRLKDQIAIYFERSCIITEIKLRDCLSSSVSDIVRYQRPA